MKPPTDPPRIPISDDDLRVVELTGALADRTRDPGSFTDEDIRMLLDDRRADAVIDILDDVGIRRGAWTDMRSLNAGSMSGRRWLKALTPLAAAAVIGIVAVVGFQPGTPTPGPGPGPSPGVGTKNPLGPAVDLGTLLNGVELDGATRVLSVVPDGDAIHIDLAIPDTDNTVGVLTLIRNKSNGARVPDFHIQALDDLSLLVFASNSFDTLALTALGGSTAWGTIDASGGVDSLWTAADNDSLSDTLGDTLASTLREAHTRRLGTLGVAAPEVWTRE